MKKVQLLLVVLNSCFFFSATVLATDGFGQYTTGGAGGETHTVTTAADFKSYVETVGTPYIVQVQGAIDLNSVASGKVSIQSNKTIRGIGENPTIIGSLAFKKGSSNVIIERLNITCPTASYGEGDGISVKEDINNVFITKCTVHDCWDGLVDVTRRSDWVTISWCNFYFSVPDNNNHNRVTLIGSSDDPSPPDEGKFHITFHHNWYGQYCIQRIPSVRFGRAHIYNNYYSFSNNIYGVWSRIKAECLIENNYFQNVNNPYYNIDYYGDEIGKISASGNILDNCTGEVHDGTDTVFTPPYSYTLNDANYIPAIVQYGAGAGGKEGYPPHWYFTLYGDFDKSGLVDINDLETFVGYWLDTNDVDDVNDADHDGDGTVDGYEYALFARNYLYVPPDTTPPAVPTDLWAQAGDSVVSLDWDDNGESDLAGYNIYRSTTSGSSYAKLNGSLLADSNYVDNTVTNGTMYYYVATAVDTNDNESADSVEACAVPDANTSVIIQENATGFCDVDGAVESEYSEWTGSGYANTVNAAGNGVDWSINIPTAGTYTFKWRYANASGDRPAKLLINDSEEVSSISFPGTGAWGTWSEASAQVTLTTGIKDVRLEANTSGGLANIDYLMVTGADPQIAGCP